MLLPERFAERFMNAPQAIQLLAIAEQVHDPGLFLQRSRNDDEELPARPEARQTGLDVLRIGSSCNGDNSP